MIFTFKRCRLQLLNYGRGTEIRDWLHFYNELRFSVDSRGFAFTNDCKRQPGFSPSVLLFTSFIRF